MRRSWRGSFTDRVDLLVLSVVVGACTLVAVLIFLSSRANQEAQKACRERGGSWEQVDAIPAYWELSAQPVYGCRD